ncbi:uncharacterized protein BP5553_10033 [Venustampulla echinocandica]|uniref:Mid2 domain-containing protein n=1 Tax=Venustampulla echinocandica TaxID=2656787 RepID=A0A370TA54_9HELO|nr:uncharacterized protein BP5553_10033 [Venustampulla echinocandica]RDL30688.1 hypothetical protein BP5553_10033 [Venustampulla echinocandica]
MAFFGVPKTIRSMHPDTLKPFSILTPLVSCSPLGTTPLEFCCKFNSTSCCNGTTFKLGDTGAAFQPGQDSKIQSFTSAALAAAISGSAVPGSAIDSNSSNPDFSNRDLATKIGVGIGVPLAVFGSGILVFLVWREKRKNNVNAEKPIQIIDPGIFNKDPPASNYALSPPQRPTPPWRPASVYEAPTEMRTHELPDTSR